MSDPGRFVEESFRTPRGESSPSVDAQTTAEPEPDSGASPELTTRSGRKRRYPVLADKSSTKKTKMSKGVTSAEIEAIVRASVVELSKNIGGMETRLKGQLDKVEDKVGHTNSELNRLEKRVTEHESKTESRIDRLERLVLNNSSSASSTAGSSSGTFLTAPSTAVSTYEGLARSTRREEQYWHCRKSLRLWPVPGPDLVEGVLTFIEKELCFERGDISPSDYRVERFHESNRNRQKVKGEVVVTFTSVALRDAVRSCSYNLSGEAGMKIHLPDHLKANFRHLDGVCFDLKKKYKSLKRNIKFDDDVLDLYADVQLEPDTAWKRLLPSDARISRAAGRFLPESASLTPDVLSNLLGDDDSDDYSSASSQTPATGSNSIPTGTRTAKDQQS